MFFRASYGVLSLLLLFSSCGTINQDRTVSFEEKSVQQQKHSVDRYCFSLDLKNDSSLIQEYKHLHTPEGMWPEIPVGIKEAGCLDMEIYLIHTRMFLIVEIEKGASLDSVWTQMGLKERQDEWAQFVRKFQEAIPDEDKNSSWILMEKVYDLDDYFLDTKED